MEYLRKLSKETYLLFIIILLASFLRFFWLDKVPNAIGGDELIYVLNAKSMLLSGTDLTGTWNPLTAFIFNYPPNQMQAELPYFLLLPILSFVKLSLLSVKAIYAIMSIFTVLLIYLITKRLFDKNIAIAAGFISAINPWFIYIGRTSYEMTPAVLFFLVGLYLLLETKARKILTSLLFFVLAFYSYIGTKIIFFPFIFVSIFYSYFYINKKKFTKQYLLILFLSLFLVVSFALALKNSPSSRLGEIISPNDPAISKRVDYLRKSSIQNPLTNIFESKPGVFINIISTKFLNTLSLDYLFVQGDEFFSNLNHGLFYYLDFAFLILGIGFAFIKNRKVALFLLSLILISVIPHVLHGVSFNNFTPHISLIFPFLIIFIATGIWGTISFYKSKIYLITSLCLIVFLYLISVVNFLNIYYYQFPLQGYFNFPVREVSKYISINSSEKIIVYSPRSYDIFTKYLFYQDILNDKTLPKVRASINSKTYKLNNVEFVSCNNTLDFSKTKETVIYDAECGALPENIKHLAISRLTDGGQVYEIFNDSICRKYNLKPYPQNIKLSDFSIESLSNEKFCQTFITSF